MKIAVLGTSNSVLKSGYFETYKALEYPVQTDLFAIGGTVISYAAFALEYYSILQNYDVIITEFSTNDSRKYKKNIINADYLYRYIYDVFAAIHAAGKIHINLLMGHPQTATNSAIYALYRYLGEKFRTKTIEVHEIVSKANKTNLWLDDDHYKSTVIKHIAYIIQKHRIKLTADMPKADNTENNLPPVRTFSVRTFEKQTPTENRGTSLYTLPLSIIDRSAHFPQTKTAMQIEGFFYRSTPFIGTVTLSDGNAEHPCHLFRAATGFFYHYFLNDITGNHFALHNRSETNFNPTPFEMAGALFSEKISGNRYPQIPEQELIRCSAAVPTAYEKDLADYIKISVFAKTLRNNSSKIQNINDPTMLFAAAEVTEQHETAAVLYSRVCQLTKYSNPYFIKCYLEKLLLADNQEELADILQLLPEFSEKKINLIIAQCHILLNNIMQAQQILAALNRNFPHNADILSLLAKISQINGQYQDAIEKLTECRKLNDQNLSYANDLLSCYIKLDNKPKIQELLQNLEKYVIQCAKIQFRLNFKILIPSFMHLTKEQCGSLYPFVRYMIKNNFDLNAERSNNK